MTVKKENEFASVGRCFTQTLRSFHTLAMTINDVDYFGELSPRKDDKEAIFVFLCGIALFSSSQDSAESLFATNLLIVFSHLLVGKDSFYCNLAE